LNTEAAISIRVIFAISLDFTPEAITSFKQQQIQPFSSYAMFSLWNKPYYLVSQNDPRMKRKSNVDSLGLKKSVCEILGFLVAIVLMVAIVFTSIVSTSRTESQPSLSDCGNSPSTARTRGCSFDLISFAWQTPECFDASLVSEFATWDDWTFYTDRKGNMTVPQEVALLGEQSLWVTWDYHLVHCTFMWRQMHRAYEKGWIDAHLHAYNHTLHCQKMLLIKGMDAEVIITRADVIYPACEMVGGEARSNWWNNVYSSSMTE
jgi:hypothetical protein